jgi:hypothetical protein
MHKQIPPRGMESKKSKCNSNYKSRFPCGEWKQEKQVQQQKQIPLRGMESKKSKCNSNYKSRFPCGEWKTRKASATTNAQKRR